MALELNQKQREGLEIAISRYEEGYPYTCIAGYAGTGKSTLVQFIIAALGFDAEDVAYAAYTGKAALVLKQKGCPNAITTHQLLYHTKQRRDGSFFHVPKYTFDKDYGLIVIDEISMLPKTMWQLLLSHGVYVLALGDPGQLPPVSDDDNEVLNNPHVFLDEIMRQEDGSEIIKLSMDIRQGYPLHAINGQEVKVVPKSAASLGMCKWADQIICATNAMRDNLNCQMRKELFNTEDRFPQDGDRIVCLRNDWDIINGRGDCLINGMCGTISNIYKFPVHIPNRAYNGYAIQADFLPDFYDDIEDKTKGDPYFRGLIMDYNIFMEGKPTLTKENFAKVAKFFKPKEFDYAYAMTCWKSQGSEFDNVLLYEEGFPRGELHQQYLYTGITRARNKLVVVMK